MGLVNLAPHQRKELKVEECSLKKCSKCGEEKLLCEFSKDKSKPDGYYSSCKECLKEYSKFYYSENKERINKYTIKWFKNNKKKVKKQRHEHYLQNKEQIIKTTKEYAINNKEKVKQYHQEYQQENKLELKNKKHNYYLDHKEEINQKNRLYGQENKDKLRIYYRDRDKLKRQTNISFKILKNLRSRIRIALQNKKKINTTIKLIGCSINELKQHLESQFTEGMSWNNYGIKGWHIDHIKPCKLFNLSQQEEQKICFHYTNLQPLWWYDNLKKSGKYVV